MWGFNRILVIAILASTTSISEVKAHSGGLDKNGGHYDHQRGVYHYHQPKRSSSSMKNTSYIVAAAGAVVLTVYIWNHYRNKTRSVRHQPYRKFRRTGTLNFQDRSDRLMIGINLQDLQHENNGHISQRLGDNTWGPFKSELRNNYEEHLGFTLGAIRLGVSSKHVWDQRRSDLDESYRKLRAHLRK